MADVIPTIADAFMEGFLKTVPTESKTLGELKDVEEGELLKQIVYQMRDMMVNHKDDKSAYDREPAFQLAANKGKVFEFGKLLNAVAGCGWVLMSIVSVGLPCTPKTKS
ncbi:hypothetical protein DFJ77DRAFT_442610 [Powellomyces hirtus]|nr:hypothetical protein DFJ77DRAFT_442610 [Powellomyces hirtus]